MFYFQELATDYTSTLACVDLYSPHKFPKKNLILATKNKWFRLTQGNLTYYTFHIFRSKLLRIHFSSVLFISQ